MSFLFKKQIKYRTIMVFTFFLAIISAGCLSIDRAVEYQENRTALLITEDLENEEFLSLLLGNKECDINSGVEIEKIKIFSQSEIPGQPEGYYSLLILNHAAEPVKFKNIGFNVEVFEYYPDSMEGSWQRVNLPYTPEETQKTLPPNLETFDSQLINTWEFSRNSDFVDVKSEIIRVAVNGLGLETSICYYAFIDLSLE